ncbi:glycosyltransferase [Flavobacterium sp. 83]|jgi:glycosyltransferase involved in cell wall biosynthesis|uniref:glycosyltransferase n=1 Tax=Flavobacterium sp. 83 TaxID=1131812 RepID=UPI000551EE27|nr:glycosyltransferase [Flavobacterium sp. 83]
MKKIKIAHVLHSVGGVDVSLRLILENSNPSQFENIVIHGIVDTTESFYDKNKVIIKEFKLPISREITFLNDLISIIKTYQILKNEKPDVIHCHSAKGGVIGRIVAILTGTPVLYTPQAFSYLSTDDTFKRSVFLFIEKLLSKGNVTLLACSKSEMKRAIEEVGFKEENVLLFNNAIRPIDKIDSLSIKKTWPDNYICTVGRPSYQKNIEFMIRVLYEIKKTTNIHLVIMGVGPVSDNLDSVKNLIIELDMSTDITLLNWTKRTDVFNIINDAKFYISTARYEGLPYSIIESMTLGTPCIVSDCDGNRDLITNNFNGYLVKENDIADFSAKCIKLLNEEELHATFSKNAKNSFEQDYNILKKIVDLETIYLKQSNLKYKKSHK